MFALDCMTNPLEGESIFSVGLEEYFDVFLFWTAEASPPYEDFHSKLVPDTSKTSEPIIISIYVDGSPDSAQDRRVNTSSDHTLARHAQTDILPTSPPALSVPSESSTLHIREKTQDKQSNTEEDVKVHQMNDNNSEYTEDKNSESFEPQLHFSSTIPALTPGIIMDPEEREQVGRDTDDEAASVLSDSSDDSGANLMSKHLWPHEDTPEAQVHSPISTELWSIEYTSHTKNAIEMALNKIGVSYFFALTVLRVGTVEVPVIVVVTDTSEDIAPIHKNLESITQNSNYVWIFGKGKITPSAITSSRTTYPRYHKNITFGDAIEARKNEAGSVGLFIREPSSECFHGITAGHVFEDSHPGKRVIQPTVKHLNMDIEHVQHMITRLQTIIKRNTDARIRSEHEDDLRNFQQQLEVLQGLKGTGDNESRKNLKIGKVISYEFCPVVYEERDCMSDWGIFEIIDERRPEPDLFTSYPESGVLATKQWDSVKQFGTLKWDQWVRKTGHITGLTFGFVAGVHAGWNPGIENCPPLTEYYVLEEKASGYNKFAAKGDSGSAVITAEGDFVGIVFAMVDVDEISVVVDVETKVPDILTIEHRRRSDGSVDDHRLWTDWFTSKSFILVECAEMVRKRARIQGEISPTD
jgi:hypothetical protein